MPLINATYFQGSNLIPKANSADGLLADVTQAIADYEPAYLRAALGDSMYVALLSAQSNANQPYFTAPFTDRFLKSSLELRWSWLINGHTYTIQDRTIVWPGLAAQRGPIANYVYWKHRRDNITTTQSTGGETFASYENSDRAWPVDKMVTAWNDMVKQNHALWSIVANSALYPEFQRSEVEQNPDSYSVYHRINAFGI